MSNDFSLRSLGRHKTCPTFLCFDFDGRVASEITNFFRLLADFVERAAQLALGRRRF
jgi:hypothetical protein